MFYGAVTAKLDKCCRRLILDAVTTEPDLTMPQKDRTRIMPSSRYTSIETVIHIWNICETEQRRIEHHWLWPLWYDTALLLFIHVIIHWWILYRWPLRPQPLRWLIWLHWHGYILERLCMTWSSHTWIWCGLAWCSFTYMDMMQLGMMQL